MGVASLVRHPQELDTNGCWKMTEREIDREVLRELLCRLLGPVMVKLELATGPRSAAAQIRDMEEEVRRELVELAATAKGEDCHPLCAKKAGHEGSCSGLADDLERVRPTWPAFNHTREDSPLNPCETCQQAVLDYVEWLEGDLKRLEVDLAELEEARAMVGPDVTVPLALKMGEPMAVLSRLIAENKLLVWDPTTKFLHSGADIVGVSRNGDGVQISLDGELGEDP